MTTPDDDAVAKAARDVLRTRRLTLRRIDVGDADFICALLNEPSFIRFIGDRGVRTPEDARRYISDGPVASYARYGFGLWLAQLEPLLTPVGLCGLVKRDGLEHPDIGFAFLPAYWGRGLAAEAGRAVLDHARSRLGLSRILGVVTPENEASIRVLEKLGLRFERTIRLPADDAELRLYASDG